MKKPHALRKQPEAARAAQETQNQQEPVEPEPEHPLLYVLAALMVGLTALGAYRFFAQGDEFGAIALLIGALLVFAVMILWKYRLLRSEKDSESFGPPPE